MRRSVISLALLGSLTSACADDRPTGEGAGEAETSGASESDSTGPSETEGETGETGDEPPAAICTTPLSETITAAAIAEHLVAFDAIANEHGGNRSAGSPGYEASAAYVEARLQEAGYQTSRWPVLFDRYVLLSPGQLSAQTDPPQALAFGIHYAVPNWSPSGSVSAAIDPVDLELGLGNLSTSGCEAEDFAEFTPGNIALIQRGGCTFVTKVSNAEAAGAVGVLLFNQGDVESRLGLFAGTLGSSNTLTIPVLFTTYAVGAELADAAALTGVVVDMSVDADIQPTETFNVLAETAAGDPDHVVMLGAHLDSVPAGPGVNDNGSGSATLLELAEQLAACSPNHRVRFAWWGGEEWGLHGSRQWVAALTGDELARLALYLNFDMLASPNFVRFVHHGADGPEGSTLLYDAFMEWFDAHELATVGAGFAGNSDYQPFVDAGVPSSGLATGAGGSKTEDQAQTYGGAAGEAYDACYHLACDGQQNFAADALEQNARAAAHSLQKWATDLGPLAGEAIIVTAPTNVTISTAHECGHDHE